MTNGKLLRLLEAIKILAVLPYPFSSRERDLDSRLVLALGQIGGLAAKAIEDHRPEHDSRE
jgi:hypothetical protein